MGVLIHFLEFLKGDVSVNLSGLQPGVSEEFLDRLQISIVIEHRRGKGVPQYVRATFLLEGHHSEFLAHHALYSPGGDAFSFACEKKKPVLASLLQLVVPHVGPDSYASGLPVLLRRARPSACFLFHAVP